jgi:hypothetical protein
MDSVRVALLFLVCGFAGLASGCGGGGSASDAAPSDSAAVQEAAAALPYCTSKPALTSVTDLSGTWIARVVGAQVVKAPTVETIHTQNVFYLLVTISQNGADLVMDGHYCDRVEINPSNAKVLVIVPAAWAHTEKPMHRTGTFAPGADGFPVMTLPPFVENAGFVLDPSDPTLPTKVTDLRVIDEDGDTNPGITVVLNGMSISGSLYTVQQQTTTISAIAVASDRVEGSLTFDSLQNILASNPSSIATLYVLSTTATDPIACSSSFAMVKIAEAQALDGGAADGGEADGGTAVDGGAVGCAWVRANEAVLFP